MSSIAESDFTVTIRFEDGTVNLGANDEFFVQPTDGYESVQLDAARLTLIARLLEAQKVGA